MIRHLLIDLDGTLLGVRMEEFVPRMVESMESFFDDLLPSASFRRHLGKGLGDMMGNGDPSVTVLDVFLKSFAESAALPEEDVKDHFSRFYEGPFRDLRRMSSAMEGVDELISTARDNGLLLTLATNPIFPLAAISERMRWAGIERSSFALITSAEIMHYCKPNLSYYREILEILGAGPRECLMVGNDLEQDLAAGVIGIGTYLVSNGFQSGSRAVHPPDYRGTISDLAALLPDIKGS